MIICYLLTLRAAPRWQRGAWTRSNWWIAGGAGRWPGFGTALHTEFTYTTLRGASLVEAGGGLRGGALLVALVAIGFTYYLVSVGSLEKK